MLYIFSFVLLLNTLSIGQSIFDYKGYLTNLQSVWLQKDNDVMLLSGTAQNRFDFFIYPMDNMDINCFIKFELELVFMNNFEGMLFFFRNVNVVVLSV